MASIQLPTSGSSDSIFIGRPQFQIATKQQWSDDFKTIDYLELLMFNQTVAPTIAKATFRWHSGEIKQEDQSKFSTVKPQEIKGQFVRIQLLPPANSAPNPNQPGNNNAPKPKTVFVGIIAEEHDAVGGFDPTGSDNVATTDQEFTAFGLEYLLKKTPIYGSFITNGDGQSDYIDTPMVFNERFTHGPAAIGNRSASKITPDNENPDCYHFAQADKNNPLNSVWSVQDIAEYLLSVYPVDEEVPFTLGGLAEGALGKTQLPRVNLEGKNVFEALNTLIDRRRGVGWCIRTDASGDAETDAPSVHVFTVFDQAVTTADGDTIPANAESNPLDLSKRSDAIAIAAMNIGDDATASVGTIYVEGERVLTAFTLSVADDNLEAAWTNGEEIKFDQGANVSNTTPGFEQLNDAARMAEGLSHVYTVYRVPDDWDWTAGNGQGGSKSIANPAVNQDGSLDASTASNDVGRTWGQTFLRHLPWQRPGGTSESVPEFEAPLAWIKFQPPTPSGGQTPAKQWMPLHKPSSLAPAAHLYVLETDFAIRLGIPGEYLAASPAAALAPGTGLGSAPAPFDWNDLLITVAVRTDATLSAWGSIDGDNRNNEIYIRVPGAELWYVLPNTVYDVDASGKLKMFAGSPGSFTQGLLAQFDPAAQLNLKIRDDSSRIRRVLALAKAWYSRSRRPVEITSRKFIQSFPPGSYLSAVTFGDDGPSQMDVNCVVTQIEWDNESGVCKISGDFAEMDFAGEREDLPNLEN